MSDRLTDLRAAVREGDDAATAALVLALQPTVWAYCSAVGPESQQVALVEATFLDAFERLRAADPTEPDVVIWVLQSARSVCATAVRKDERRQRRAARSPWGATAPVTSSDAVRNLAIERREVWTLVTHLGMAPDRVARVIDASLATVSVRLGAAQRELADAVRSATG